MSKICHPNLVPRFSLLPSLALAVIPEINALHLFVSRLF